MLKILKSSFVFGFICQICNFFANAYNNSCLAKNINCIARVIKESRAYGIINSYVNKKPYYEYSVIHRLFMAVYSLVDRLMAVLNKGITAMAYSSIFCKAATNIYKSGNMLCALCIMAMGICLGMALCGSLVCLTGAVVFCVLALACRGNVLKNCFIYRFICWLVKL